jgi:hypothetical protein
VSNVFGAPPPQVVTFNYAQWCVEYPELAPYVTASQGQTYFNRACAVIDNTPSSPMAVNPFQLLIILNAATAHIASLFAMIGGQLPRALVGRITNAAEGSVNVATQYSTTPTGDIAAWWQQTSYGAYVWTMLRPYQTGFYVPPPCPPWGFGGPLIGGA